MARFRSPRQRRAVMSKLRGRSLFFPPKSKRLADIITIRSPEAARASVTEIQRMMRAGRLSRERAIRMFTVAANRALASRERVKAPLSKREMYEMTAVGRIYNDAKERL